MRAPRRLIYAISTLLVCSGLFTQAMSSQNQPTSNHAGMDHARLWKAYSARFLSDDGRIIDREGGDRTTSEGQSYALFFALVNNDRGHFDSALRWTQTNLAFEDLGAHLPAWSWGKSKEGTWGILDPNSASDSDLWIAYDLLEAGRLWHEPHYTTLGRKLAALIAHREVTKIPGLGTVLMPAAVGFRSPGAWVLNPSYTPVFILDHLSKLDPAGPWADIAAAVPAILARSSRSGFAMDWVSYSPSQGFTPALPNARKSPAALGSYDAIRVYLWTGMLNDAHPAKARMLGSLSEMNTYLQHHAAPPEKVSSLGVPQSQDGPVGFSAAVLPYLESIPNESAAAQQMVRIKSQLDEKSDLYGSPATYYNQNLVLFASGWSEKRFRFGSSGELLVPWTHE